MKEIGPDETPLVEQCELLVGKAFARQEVEEIINSRNEYITNYLQNIKNVSADRFSVQELEWNSVNEIGQKPGFDVNYTAR